VQPQDIGETLADEAQDRPAARRFWAEQNDAGKHFRRILFQAGDSVVQSEQNPMLVARRRKDRRVCRARQAFLENGVGFMPKSAQVVAGLGRAGFRPV
jgi:hypothetical protein